jgi:hypothetical protein
MNIIVLIILIVKVDELAVIKTHIFLDFEPDIVR